MGTVRIGQITGTKDLLGLYLFKQINCYLYIFFSHWLFLNGTGFIKRQVLKMHIFFRYANISTGCLCLAPPDESLYSPDLLCIDLVLFLLRKIFSYAFKDHLRFITINPGDIFKTYSKIKKARYKFIRHGNIT